MSTVNFTVVARDTSLQGKGASRRLRKQNLVPAIVYGGESQPKAIALRYNELVKALENDAFFSSILTLDGDEVIIKALQRHPAKGFPMHVDFQRVVRGQTMNFTVPVQFTGNAKGVEEGGILQTNVTELQITCLPRQLPEAIQVDVSHLAVGDLLRFSDISLPEGVSIVDLDSGATDRVVVSVQPPVVVEEETPEEAPAIEVDEVSGEVTQLEDTPSNTDDNQ